MCVEGYLCAILAPYTYTLVGAFILIYKKINVYSHNSQIKYNNNN